MGDFQLLYHQFDGLHIDFEVEHIHEEVLGDELEEGVAVVVREDSVEQLLPNYLLLLDRSWLLAQLYQLDQLLDPHLHELLEGAVHERCLGFVGAA